MSTSKNTIPKASALAVAQNKMPSQVKVALKAYLTKLESAKRPSKNAETIKSIVERELKAKLWKFQSSHDIVRQAIRVACLHDLKNMIYPSLTTTAKIYGVSPANLVKWKNEEFEGITKIRPRGRPSMEKPKAQSKAA